MSQPPADGAHRVRRVIAGTSAVAGIVLVAALAAVVTVASVPVDGIPKPTALSWAFAGIFTLAFFFLKRHGFVFYWREESTKLSLDEVALVVGLLVVPPPFVILGAAVASALAQWSHARAPGKVAFNVSQYALAATVATVGHVGLVAAGLPPFVAALSAPLTFTFTNMFLVSVIFSALDGGSPVAVFRARFAKWFLVHASVGASLGGIVYALWVLSPWTIVLVLPVFACLWQFGRLSEWADDEIATHEFLASVSAEVAGAASVESVVDRILDACHTLFDCAEARVLLRVGPDGTSREWSRRFDGTPESRGLAARVPGGEERAIGEISVYPQRGQHAYGAREQHLLDVMAAGVRAAAVNAEALEAQAVANRHLQASERRYRRLFETSNAFIHVLDADGRIVDVNAAELRALGYARHELQGLPLSRVLPAEDHDAFRDALRALTDGNELEGVEGRFLTRDGRTLHVLLDAVPLETVDEDDAPRFVVFARDITPLKDMESVLRDAMREQEETIRRLENMNRELEDFTLWTTHDLREPLRSVGALAEILDEELPELDEAETRDLVRRIRSGADRLKDRVKGLHAFSRVVQDDRPFEPVDVNAVIAETERAFTTQFREKSARLVVQDPPLPVVRAQAHRLEQVFGNLVENALKYGGPGVTITVEHDVTDEGRVFVVRDDGPGIPPEYHERIFQLFQRGPAEAEPGSGAGLAIVKRIVEQHGGTITLESAPGEGTAFRFTLPDRARTRPPDPRDGDGSVRVRPS